MHSSPDSLGISGAPSSSRCTEASVENCVMCHVGGGLDGKQWLGVLGNHDYGGFKFNSGWHETIFYTWAEGHHSTGRWFTPSQYYQVKVRYLDFSIDYYFDWQIVVSHFPPEYNADFWTEIGTRYGIDLIISGHRHYQKLLLPGETTKTAPAFPFATMISGGGGGITSDRMPELKGDDDAYGFFDLSLSRSSIHVRAFSHTGRLRRSADVTPVQAKDPGPFFRHRMGRVKLGALGHFRSQKLLSPAWSLQHTGSEWFLALAPAKSTMAASVTRERSRTQRRGRSKSELMDAHRRFQSPEPRPQEEPGAGLEMEEDSLSWKSIETYRTSGKETLPGGTFWNASPSPVVVGQNGRHPALLAPPFAEPRPRACGIARGTAQLVTHKGDIVSSCLEQFVLHLQIPLGFVNLSAVYVSQVLHRAESFGVPIDIDMAAIEDQNSIDQIASLALQGFVPAAMGKRNANLPSLGGVPPPPSPLGPAADLNTMARMQELEQENAQLRERYSHMQQQVSELTHERSQLSEQLDQAGAQVALSQSQLSEVFVLGEFYTSCFSTMTGVPSAATASKASIPSDPSHSDSSSVEMPDASTVSPRQYALLVPRRPRLHSIKGLFYLILGGFLQEPPRSCTRKTDFKLIEKLPDLLTGQFRFSRSEGTIYRPLCLTAGDDSTELWRKFTAVQYPKFVFKLQPSSEDRSYVTEEIRAFREAPDHTAQFLHEFTCVVNLGPTDVPRTPHSFHVMVCERLIPLRIVNPANLDPEELAYRMALAVAGAVRLVHNWMRRIFLVSYCEDYPACQPHGCV
eukprot:s503_g19.t1